MPRLFVAVWPPEAVLGAIGSLGLRREPGVRPVRRENLHITLRFLGEADVHAAIERLGGVGLPATTAVLGPNVERLGPTAIVVPVAGIESLARAVRDATADIGRRDRGRFTGHLTVAHARRGARPSVVGARVHAEFDVTEIALVASDLAPNGAHYTTLATFM